MWAGKARYPFCWNPEEYGIIMTKAERATADLPWLDLRDEKEESGGPKASNGSSGENGLRHINYRETLKFLDTAVKNGYNTKVN